MARTMVRRLPGPLLAVIFFGAVCQIGQVVLLRELLMVFHGNELSIGLILAAWLGWNGVGSQLGAVLVNRVHRPVFLFTLSTVVLLLILPSTIFAIRGLRAFFDVPPGTYLGLSDIIFSCLLVMAPVCVLLGAQFVLLARVWRERNGREDTSGANKAYATEALGSTVGGLVFTLLLVHYLNSFQLAILIAVLLLVGAVLTNWKCHKTATYQSSLWLVTIALCVSAAIITPLLRYADQAAYRLQWRYFLPHYQLVGIHQSKYGTISVVRLEDQYSLFQSGHLVFTIAGPTTGTPGLEQQEAATFAHTSMVQHQRPASVLLIGGGLRGTLGEIVKHPVERIDYVELDQVLTEAALAYLPRATLDALADHRVRIIHTDGRLFVKTSDDKYDMIIVDAPDPATAVLNRYYTREFFQEAAALLNPRGVMVIGTTSTPDLRGTAIANRNATIYHTLKSVFPHVLAVGDQFLFYFATDAPGQISTDATTLEERYRKRHIRAEGFAEDHFRLLFRQAELERVNWVLRNHGRSPRAHLDGPPPVPLSPGAIEEQERTEANLPPAQPYFINSDFRPIAYYYTVMLWDERARTGHHEAFRRLLHVEATWVLPLVFLPLLIVTGLRIAGRRLKGNPDTGFAVLFAVFTTGLSTMALQIALLFAFQGIYGFIYEMVGLIVAIFMAGLGVGTLTTHRYVADKANLNTLTVIQLSIALVAALIAVVVPTATDIPSPTILFLLFSILTFVAGFINGADFPLTTASFMALRRGPETAAGTVYSVELLGACLGAVIASALVAPILGIVACCLMASVANGTAFVVLLICRRH